MKFFLSLLSTAFFFTLCLPFVHAFDTTANPKDINWEMLYLYHCDAYIYGNWKADTNSYCETVSSEILETEEYDKVAEVFTTIREAYHKNTNDYFNEYIEKLSGTTFQCDERRGMKALETNIEDMFRERQKEFYKYRTALLDLEQIARHAPPSESLGGEMTQVFGQVQFLSEYITHEIEISDKVLRITLSAYAEMRHFYPLHKELECLIIELQELRDAWEKYVFQVARMPAKFINASGSF